MTEPTDPGAPEAPLAPEAPVAAEERRDETRRGAFQPGLWLRLILIAAGAVYLILFVVLNTRTVRVRFVFDSTRVSLIWVIVLSVLIGIVLGVLLSQVHRFRSRRAKR
jgi:uncharacterized integral membrane protein